MLSYPVEDAAYLAAIVNSSCAGSGFVAIWKDLPDCPLGYGPSWTGTTMFMKTSSRGMGVNCSSIFNSVRAGCYRPMKKKWAKCKIVRSEEEHFSRTLSWNARENEH
jgi:hypothetical protein